MDPFVHRIVHRWRENKSDDGWNNKGDVLFAVGALSDHTAFSTVKKTYALMRK